MKYGTFWSSLQHQGWIVMNSLTPFRMGADSFLSSTLPPFRLVPQLVKLILKCPPFCLAPVGEFELFKLQPQHGKLDPSPTLFYDKNPNHQFFSLLKSLWIGLGPALLSPESPIMWVANLFITLWWCCYIISLNTQANWGRESGVGGEKGCPLWGNHKTGTNLTQISEYFDLDFF